MHVFAESDVFAALSSSNAQLKGNDGKASRRLQKRKIIFVTIVSCSIFSCLYFIRTGKGLHKLTSKLRPQKIHKDEIIDSQKISQTVSQTGSRLHKLSSKLRPQKIHKDEIIDSQTNSQTDSQTGSMQKPNKSEEEEGRLITFHVSNLEGSPGSEGTFTIRTRPSWSPKGAQRFEDLTEQSFWNGCRFFRAIGNFVVQWGINGDPNIQKKWRAKVLEDEEVKASNDRGTVVFAMSGPNTRTTQMYINTGKNNKNLDKQGFTPIGTVIRGMDVVDQIYTGYGGDVNQGKIQNLGNKFLEDEFPKLSFISEALFDFV